MPQTIQQFAQAFHSMQTTLVVVLILLLVILQTGHLVGVG
jgi:hypothetical protein